jgi:NitT/TauT family transport system substrate-binding protein
MIVRRLSPALAAALITALMALAIPRTLAGETLKIASPQRGSWEGAIPELGTQVGIFQKHGLDLEILYTQGGGETLQIVISGAVDIGLSAGTLGTLGAYAKGAPVRIIAASSTGSQELFWFVPARSPLKSMRDVNGQRIAYSTTGASTHINVLRLINEYGLNARPVATGDAASTITQTMSGGGLRGLVGRSVRARCHCQGRGAHDRTRERPRRRAGADHPRADH